MTKQTDDEKLSTLSGMKAFVGARYIPVARSRRECTT